MYDHPLPDRVRMLVLGGGAHGLGVLHDMASRGWRDIHLIEKSTLVSGTSSKSTKLIHGGLRYLQHVKDFGLVSEALHERQILMNVAADIVKPIELIFPVLKKGGMPGFMINIGLTLYDFLAGRYKIHAHRRLTASEVTEKSPILAQDQFSRFYSFWDCQMDDLALGRRIAASAVKLGASITEGCRATRITASDDGWNVEIVTASGQKKTVSALYVMNATGPWSNKLLEQSQIAPSYEGINVKGAHLILPDLGLKSGLFLQSPEDKRIFFMLPWLGRTLLGTTEDRFDQEPDAQRVSAGEIKYLLSHCNRYLNRTLTEADILTSFSGLRWLALDEAHSLTATSRAYNIGERAGKRGLLLTLYGGKWSTYRSLAQTLGDRITRHFGEFRPSRTREADFWATAADEKTELADEISRFLPPSA